MNTLEIDGLNVQTQGSQTKQSIVFIHGFPFDHTLWNNVIKELKDTFYCVSYDIRGFGNSQCGTGQYTMESYVNDLENIIFSLKLDHPIICGFSMGGYIALRANTKQPQNYKAMILANTTSSSDNDEGKLKRSNAILEIDKNGLKPFLDNFFPVAFSDHYFEKHPLKIEELKEKIINFNPLGIKGGLLAMISRTDTTENLQKTDIPVLLISGDKDKIIPSHTMEQMANSLKNSTHIPISGSGHMSMIENPTEFNEAINDFLK